MEKLIALLQDKLEPLCQKLQTQVFLRAIHDSFLGMAPISFVSAIVLIIKQFVELFGITNEALSDLCGLIYRLGLGAVSLYLVLFMAYHLCHYKKKDPLMTMALSVLGFVLVCIVPYGDLHLIDGRGILWAILIPIFVSRLYPYYNKKFSDLSFLPFLAETMIVVIFCLLYLLIRTYGTILEGYLACVIKPLDSFSDSFVFVLFVTVLLHVTWFLGMHDSAYAGILAPIREGHLSINGTAFLQGTALPYIFTTPFWVYFVILGGCGSLFPLVILLNFSRSKKLKDAGKVGLIPCLFNITEPLMFSVPIVANMTLFIPFVLVSALNAGVSYLAMGTGLINKAYALPSWNLPSFIGAYLSTGDLKAGLLVLGLLVMDGIIWYPFFKIHEKDILKTENNEIVN